MIAERIPTFRGSNEDFHEYGTMLLHYVRSATVNNKGLIVDPILRYAKFNSDEPVPGTLALPSLREATILLNEHLGDLECALNESGNDVLRMNHVSVERAALLLNTSLVNRERGVFDPTSVTLNKDNKHYVVEGLNKATGERELLHCGTDLFFGGEGRTQLARDDSRDEAERQLGWSDESQKVLAACGPGDLAFITPKAGDIYKLMKAGVKFKDTPDGGKLFTYLKDHFWGLWTSTLDRVRYQDKGKQDILVYNMGLGPNLERCFTADIKGGSDFIQGPYAQKAERALQELLDTNDSLAEIKNTIEPYSRNNKSYLWRIDKAGERVVRLGGYGIFYGGFVVGAGDGIVRWPSLRVARVKRA